MICVTNSFSKNSCLKLNDLFCVVFPDSAIAQSFKLGAEKIRYAFNFGIASYLRSLLVDEIKKSSCFVPCFDESLNSQTQTCEMDLVIRYFNNTKRCVDVRYFYSSFFGHGTAIDLRREFDECIKELRSFKNVPNVNEWSTYELGIL